MFTAKANLATKYKQHRASAHTCGDIECLCLSLLVLYHKLMCFQGEVEIRQINGHSSEEEKEDEEKERWPDDHSSSR